MPEIEKILAGRKAIEGYKAAHAKLHSEHPEGGVSEQHTPLLEKMLSELKALGFNSTEEFMEADGRAILEDVARCTRYRGKCDFCKGREMGCVRSCYEEQTKPDKNTPTGRTALIPKTPVKNWGATLVYYKDYYKTLPPRKKGRITPLVPNCSIMVELIEDPAFNWFWR